MTVQWPEYEPGWYVVTPLEGVVGFAYPVSRETAEDACAAFRPHTGEVVHVPEPTDMDVLRIANGLTR